MTDIYHRPIAFNERESCHPETGAHGILRKEWRIVPVNYANPAHIGIARDRNPSLILEQRYIRRGTVEPWEIFDAYDTETEALSAIDHKAIAIDCPPLLWVQHEYKRQCREYEEQQAREREEKYRREEERRLRGLSHDAWTKLFNSPRYRPLCDEWNSLTTSPGALSLKTELQADREFMRLYTLATISSTTSMSKRSAIRACIDYYNFMWKHREPITTQETDS